MIKYAKNSYGKNVPLGELEPTEVYIINLGRLDIEDPTEVKPYNMVFQISKDHVNFGVDPIVLDVSDCLYIKFVSKPFDLTGEKNPYDLTVKVGVDFITVKTHTRAPKITPNFKIKMGA